VEYLWGATQIAPPSSDLTLNQQQISKFGLDLTSCIHFMLELYNQWTTEVIFIIGPKQRPLIVFQLANLITFLMLFVYA